MPDPSTRAVGWRFPVRNTYSLEAWMDAAIIQAAHNAGVTQAEVVRKCLEHGLAGLYGLRRPSPHER